jgi:hypothetical protein
MPIAYDRISLAKLLTNLTGAIDFDDSNKFIIPEEVINDFQDWITSGQVGDEADDLRYFVSPPQSLAPLRTTLGLPSLTNAHIRDAYLYMFENISPTQSLPDGFISTLQNKMITMEDSNQEIGAPVVVRNVQQVRRPPENEWSNNGHLG